MVSPRDACRGGETGADFVVVRVTQRLLSAAAAAAAAGASVSFFKVFNVVVLGGFCPNGRVSS